MTKAEAIKRFSDWADDKLKKQLEHIAADMKAELSDIRDDMLRWKAARMKEVEQEFDAAEEHARQNGADDVVFVNLDDERPCEPPTTIH